MCLCIKVLMLMLSAGRRKKQSSCATGSSSHERVHYTQSLINQFAIGGQSSEVLVQVQFSLLNTQRKCVRLYSISKMRSWIQIAFTRSKCWPIINKRLQWKSMNRVGKSKGRMANKRESMPVCGNTDAAADHQQLTISKSIYSLTLAEQ